MARLLSEALLSCCEHPHSDTPATRISAKTRTAGTPGPLLSLLITTCNRAAGRALAAPAHHDVVVVREQGRASGPITFIHAFVVWTFHS